MSPDEPMTSSESGADGSLPRYFLRSALHLALIPGRYHGYDLLEQVKLFGLTTVDLAGIYRSMKAMEHDGLVSSEWESSELGPPRRVYELTSLGRTAADQHRVALSRARDHLDFMITSASIDDGCAAKLFSGPRNR